MDCEFSYDNRETCIDVVSSSCVPYVGYISDTIKDKLPECKPNINDVFKALQEVIDKIKLNLGDNTQLDKNCFDFDETTVTQEELNQLYIDEICLLKDSVGSSGTVSPATISLMVNLLCLQDPACTPQTSYTLQEIIEKLITAYCNLLTRVTNIETILNI